MTLIVNDAVSPALIGLEPLLITSRAGPTTSTWAVSWSLPSLVVVTTAVLTTGLSARVAFEVGLVRWTV